MSEYNCASSEFPVDPESKRVMAFDLFDCVRSGGINIGKHLIDLGLAKQEEGEEVFINGKLGYTKVRQCSVEDLTLYQDTFSILPTDSKSSTSRAGGRRLRGKRRTRIFLLVLCSS